MIITPQNLADVAKIADGSTVQFVGNFATKIIFKACNANQVTLDFTKATFNWIVFDHASNYKCLGGLFTNAPYMQIQTISSDNIIFEGGEYTSCGNCAISLKYCTDITIDRNKFHTGRFDAIDNNSGQKITVTNNKFYDMDYDTTLHVDAFQCWNDIGQPICTDITIEDNIVNGHMQGFGCYTHPGPQNLARVVVRRNIIASSLVWGIHFPNTIDSIMEDNYCTTLSEMPKGYGGVRCLMTGTNVTICNNKNGAIV